MSEESFRAYLEGTFHKKIPITREMGIRVLRYDGSSLVLSAPLAPNVNDKCTAFGGSLYTLLVLAGWGLVHLRLREEGIPGDAMIHESSVTYSQPVTDAWQVSCSLPEAAEYERFINRLRTRGRARLALESRIMAGNQVAVSFRGNYAAIAR